MTTLARPAPIAAGLAGYAAFGALLPHIPDVWIFPAHLFFIISLAAAISFASAFSDGVSRRMLNAIWIGLVVSLLMIVIVLAVTWIEDRRNFYNDGGPTAAVLIVGLFDCLPMVGLAILIAGLVQLWPRLRSKRAGA